MTARLLAEATPVESVEVEGGEPETLTDPGISLTNVHFPSSAGVSFAVDERVARVSVEVSAARYKPEMVESGSDERGVPKRGGAVFRLNRARPKLT